MARPKRNSAVLTQAERRLLGMKAISAKLDLGGGCSTATVAQKVTEVRENLQNYHTLLAKADAAANELERSEKELSKLSKKVLLGVAVKFDKESDEYEMVGGVRPSDRKRPRRSVATAVTA